MTNIESSIKSFNDALNNIKEIYKMNSAIDISDRYKVINALTNLQNAFIQNPKDEDYIYLKLFEIEELAETIFIEGNENRQLKELRASVDRLINDILYYR